MKRKIGLKFAYIPLNQENRMLRVGFGKFGGLWFVRVDFWFFGIRLMRIDSWS